MPAAVLCARIRINTKRVDNDTREMVNSRNVRCEVRKTVLYDIFIRIR